MQAINLQGLGVALITPFQSTGEIDEDALLRIVDLQLQNKVDYLVILGTTSEMPTLSTEERDRIVRLVVERVNGKIPIIVGLGGNNTLKTAQRLQNSDWTGISAILSVVPYYNKPTQEGIYQHYKYLADVSPLPIILYNVPGRTGANMSAETTLRLARDSKNIVAIKEASGNLEQIKQIIDNKPADFQVISGDDCLILPLVKMGASGVISVLGNAFPKETRLLTHAALNNDTATAEGLHLQLKTLCELLFIDGNPAGIKAILHHKELIENKLRLPLVPVTETTYTQIGQAIQALQQ
ncbi:MAG: 4-hydroxy-tetrahydrodipicolinate synthase [Candidatus Symbiothrix sp.]|jgi:4-hydroxy-tetrahydrodipicolinate synthase|nr:4-hydroxy-tetrahydrodipicolinate synthase [Candidatus Symbiothrix sp.]